MSTSPLVPKLVIDIAVVGADRGQHAVLEEIEAAVLAVGALPVVHAAVADAGPAAAACAARQERRAAAGAGAA